MNYEGACPIIVLHVRGEPPLSQSDRSWFEEKVKDFVWDYRRDKSVRFTARVL